MEDYRHQHKEKYNVICDVFLALDTLETCKCFLFDLFTIQELDMLAQRLQIAKCFYEGTPTYNQVVEAVKVSSATVSRVRHAYKHGNDGFRMVFDNMNSKTK